MRSLASVGKTLADGLVGSLFVVLIEGIHQYITILNMYENMTPKMPMAMRDPFGLTIQYLFDKNYGGGGTHSMPVAILIAFIFCVVNMEFVENIVFRKEWIKAVLIACVITWLAGSILLVCFDFLVPTFQQFIVSRSAGRVYFEEWLFFIPGTISRSLNGVFSAWVIGSLVGCFFNPSNRFFKLLIVSVITSLICIAESHGLFGAQIVI